MGEFLSCPVYLSGLCFWGDWGFPFVFCLPGVCVLGGLGGGGKYPSQGTCERNLADFLGFLRAPSNPCLREADPRDQEALLRAMVKRSRVMGPPRLPVLARLLRLAYVASTTGSPETTDKLGGAAVTGTRAFQATPAHIPPALWGDSLPFGPSRASWPPRGICALSVLCLCVVCCVLCMRALCSVRVVCLVCMLIVAYTIQMKVDSPGGSRHPNPPSFLASGPGRQWMDNPPATGRAGTPVGRKPGGPAGPPISQFSF